MTDKQRLEIKSALLKCAQENENKTVPTGATVVSSVCRAAVERIEELEHSKNLDSTIALMVSRDFKDRFKAEAYQLVIRRDGLKRMLEKWENHELDFEPNCPKELLEKQLKVMDEYLEILDKRAEIEDIDL